MCEDWEILVTFPVSCLESLHNMVVDVQCGFSLSPQSFGSPVHKNKRAEGVESFVQSL